MSNGESATSLRLQNRPAACAVMIIFLLMLSGGSCLAQKKPLKITIFRQSATEKCTSGYIAVDGNIVAYTVELPFVNNISCISSIPSGTYTAMLRYDKSDKWRIELKDVPERSGIQIHVGNWPREIQGCVLVGAKLAADGCSIQAGTSKPAYDDLRRAFYKTAIEKDYDAAEIDVEMTGEFKEIKVPGQKPVDPCPK
jgi:hypothetical protein